MHRIRELFDHFIAACKANYQPGEKIALDEAMKMFKGCCIFKQISRTNLFNEVLKSTVLPALRQRTFWLLNSILERTWKKLLKREMSIPSAVHSYNQNMGAVDTFDQYRSYIKLELRSGKFWHPMMWFIFESSLVNSWILYKLTMQQAELPLAHSHFTFRKSVALALAAEWESWGCSPKTTFESPTKVMQENHGKAARQRFSVAGSSTRYTCPQK